MDPEIVELDEMTVVGIQSLISSKHNLIPKLWGRFMTRDKEVKYMSNKNAAFGVSFDMQEIPSEGEDAKKEYQFFHLVGLAVDSTNNIPEGMQFFLFCPLSRKEKVISSLRPLRLERSPPEADKWAVSIKSLQHW